MAYTKNTWVDQNVSRPRTYTVTTNADETITLTDSFGTVTELGTSVNAANMNHIENGIYDCDQALASKANISLSNIDATGEARFTAKANINADNFSTTGKTTIRSWNIPDYTSGQSISSGSSIPENGWVLFKQSGGGTNGSAAINGITVASNYGVSGVSTDFDYNLCPVASGDVITLSRYNCTYFSYRT